MQSQSILHVRRYEYHRTGMAFSYLRHQRSAGGTGKFAQLALIARFCRQRVTLFSGITVVSISFVLRRTLRVTLQAASWLAARQDSMKDSGIQGHMTDKQCSLLSAIVVY